MKIRTANNKDSKEALSLAKELKEWFTKEAIINMKIDFSINNLAVYIDKNKVIGFICYNSDNGIVKIVWLGVKRDYQRKGVGTSLLNFLINEAKKLKASTIQVETLVEEETYEPYKLTRAFYYKHGFNKLYIKKAIKPGWDDQVVLEKKLKYGKE